MADYLSDGIRKLILIGIGAAASTAEKSQKLVDELVKKGELTVEQGKVLNQELQRKVSEASKPDSGKIAEELDKLSPEELQTLRDKLAEMDSRPADKAKEAGNGSAK